MVRHVFPAARSLSWYSLLTGTVIDCCANGGRAQDEGTGFSSAVNSALIGDPYPG